MKQDMKEVTKCVIQDTDEILIRNKKLHVYKMLPF